MSILQQKLFKSKASKQLTELESNAKNFIKLDYFRSQHEVYEQRIRDHLEAQFLDVNG